jgi:hypothetical protein
VPFFFLFRVQFFSLDYYFQSEKKKWNRMAVCSESQCEFMLEFDNNLPFLKKGLSFLNATKPKGNIDSSSFEFTYKNAMRSEDNRRIGILRMRHSESGATLAETSLTVPFEKSPDTDDDFSFHCWINVSILHAIIKDVTLNDKMIYIGFRTSKNNELRVVLAPHHNRSGVTSIVRNEIVIRMTSEDLVPSVYFHDAEFEQLIQSIIYSFSFKISEFSESISQSSAIIKSRTGKENANQNNSTNANDKNKMFDNQNVQLLIHHVCPNFVWLSIKTGDEQICDLVQKMKCFLPQPLPCSQPVPPEALDEHGKTEDFQMFEIPPIYSGTFLHKRIYQMCTNFRGENAQIQCNIVSNRSPISFVYYSEWVKEEHLAHNYLKYTITPIL